MRRILLEFIVLIGIGGLIWAAFALFVNMPQNPTLLSIEREQTIGDKYVKYIHSLPGFYPVENDYADSILLVTANKLHEAQPNAMYTYKISLVDNEIVNAFALPGGHIIVTRGLISFCQTPEELIAVISHEIGHIENRHVISRLIKDIGIDLITSGDTYVMGEIARSIISSGYNRKQEEDADIFACKLLLKVNIEPRSLAGFFRKLKQEEDSGILEKFEVVSSHPNFTKRIKYILSFNVPDNFKAQEAWVDLNLLQKKIS